MTDETWPSNSGEPLLGDDVVDVEAAPPPTDAGLAQVRDLALRQVVLIREVNRITVELAVATEALRLNQEVDLPTLMDQLGLTDFGLAGGHSVSVTEKVDASVPVKEVERTAEAHRWLEEHGHGALIKRRITIMFDRSDEAWAKKFLADCAKRKRPLLMEIKRWVEPQTLSAFVREQLKGAKTEGLDPEVVAPTATLGVFKRKYGLVKGPNVPKLLKRGGGAPKGDADSDL